jgi:hypothetical protein
VLFQKASGRLLEPTWIRNHSSDGYANFRIFPISVPISVAKLTEILTSKLTFFKSQKDKFSLLEYKNWHGTTVDFCLPEI